MMLEATRPFAKPLQIYSAHAFFAIVSRVWDYSFILLLSDATNGNALYLVAISGFLSGCLILFLMPSIGLALDSLNRLLAAEFATAGLLVSILLAYLLCTEESLDPTTLLWIPIFTSLAHLSHAVLSQTVEKDWLVVLSDGDSSWLSSTNSVLSQIDLGTSALVPIVTGVLFSYLTRPRAAMVLLLLHVVSIYLGYQSLKEIYAGCASLRNRNMDDDAFLPQSTHSSPKKNNSSTLVLVEREESGEGEGKLLGIPSSSSSSILSSSSSSSSSSFFGFTPPPLPTSVQEFLNSGCTLYMIAYAFLHMTVLSFGSLMTVYLRWAKMSPSTVGFLRGCSSLLGFFAASIFPLLRQQFGLASLAQRAIWFQATLVMVAASSFFLPLQQGLQVLCLFTLLSRVCLWLFDLSCRQIAQECISEKVRGRVNGTWRSLVAFFEMSSFVLTMLAPDPNCFYVLGVMSSCCVTTAAIICSCSSSNNKHLLEHQSR